MTLGPNWARREAASAEVEADGDRHSSGAEMMSRCAAWSDRSAEGGRDIDAPGRGGFLPDTRLRLRAVIGQPLPSPRSFTTSSKSMNPFSGLVEISRTCTLSPTSRCVRRIGQLSFNRRRRQPHPGSVPRHPGNHGTEFLSDARFQQRRGRALPDESLYLVRVVFLLRAVTRQIDQLGCRIRILLSPKLRLSAAAE